jgi:hypothetical protein
MAIAKNSPMTAGCFNVLIFLSFCKPTAVEGKVNA